MAASQLLKSLNKAFKDALKQHSYFSEWKKGGTRRFWLASDGHCSGIELHINKFWDDGGDFLIEVTAGHPIATDVINNRFGSLEDGFYCVSRELIFVDGGDGTVGNDGRWISVNDDGDIPTAMSEVLRIIDRDGIPWLESMKQIDAFMEWLSDNSLPYALFPITLELHGVNRLREDVAEWMKSRPRNVDDVFAWLEEHSIFDQPFCDRLRRATLQSDNRYGELIVELASEIRAANG